MAGGGPEIDERLALPLGEKLAYIGWADFQLKSGGDAIHGFETHTFGREVVLMKVDEARSDDETSSINDVLAR